MWKDKVLTHINQLDQVYARSMLEKDQPTPTVLMEDFLASTPEKPEISVAKEISLEDAREERWRNQHWTRAQAAMLNLFNQSLPNAFLSTLPDHVSRMKPCDVWKELEYRYGLGDAGGVIERKRQWERLTTSNWSDLGTLFAQLKKLRNDINRKMKGLVGGEMVTETWLCMEVLALPPSEFWGSSISMAKDWFTIENVDISLRRVFGDRSKKEVGMLTDKRRPVSINVVKKRNQDEASATGNDACFYCFKTGHRKADCPVKTKDRDPNRHGGRLFRTNIRTLPGGKKERLMAVKKARKSEPAAGIAASSNEKSPIDDLLFDKELEEELRDDDELVFKDEVSM